MMIAHNPCNGAHLLAGRPCSICFALCRTLFCPEDSNCLKSDRLEGNWCTTVLMNDDLRFQSCRKATADLARAFLEVVWSILVWSILVIEGNLKRGNVRLSLRKSRPLTCGLHAHKDLAWHRQYSPPLLALSHSLHHCTSCRHQTRKLSARTWPNSRPTSVLCLMQCKHFLLHRQAQNDFKSYTLVTSKAASLPGSTVNTESCELLL